MFIEGGNVMFPNRSKGLFRGGQLRDYIQRKIDSAVSEAKALDAATFEANSDEQIVEHICSIYPIDALAIHEDEKETHLEESSIDARSLPDRWIFDTSRPVPIDSYKVTRLIPISGSVELFYLQPNNYLMTNSRGEIVPNRRLQLVTEQPAGTANERTIETDLGAQLDLIKQMAQYINNDLVSYPAILHYQVKTAVASRKQDLDKMLRLKSALRVTVEKKPTISPLNRVEIHVKTISPLSTKKENPGAYIEEEDYEVILSAIRNMGTSMETSRASAKQGEEDLRDVLLVGLNASMTIAVAGGEQFRRRGKTDILIPFENKAAFVAECKLWEGERYISEGIDQLLDYLTWRDVKTSLVIFNKRNKNFSSLQAKVPDICIKHPNFIKQERSRNGEWRFVFHKPDDEGRTIVIHVFLFDTYREEAEK